MLVVLDSILFFLVLIGMLYWLFVWGHLVPLLLNRPSARAGLVLPEPPDGAWPPLSIIVPAHNEAAIIVRCVRSLLGQAYPNLQVIIVLDRCTDDSAARLAPLEADDPRLIVIANDHCPDDWAGKCHAASIGAARATGDWLLFTDADTCFDPQLCRSTVAMAMHGRIALLSLLSTLSTEHFWERLAQPVATMTLMRMHPIPRVNRPAGGRDFANGQFLLFDRQWYEKIGGHEAVRGSLLEDIAFARHIGWHGGIGRIALADGMLTCTMYESLEAFRQGWKRIFIEVCRSQVSSLRSNAVRVLGSGVGLAIVQIAALITATVLLLSAGGTVGRGLVLLVMTAVCIAVQYTALAVIYRMGGASARSIWLYPAGCVVIARIFWDAASDLINRRPIRWGGREYILEPYRRPDRAVTGSANNDVPPSPHTEP